MNRRSFFGAIVGVLVASFTADSKSRLKLIGIDYGKDESKSMAMKFTGWKWVVITPNEVRALRGRKPYRQDGNDPLASLGSMPLPLGGIPLEIPGL